VNYLQVNADKVETSMYGCPVYKTQDRGPTWVTHSSTIKLKTSTYWMLSLACD